MADIVTVENVGPLALGVEFFLERIGNGRFAGAREAGEPNHLALMPAERLAIFAGDSKRLPIDILRAPQIMRDHPRCHGGVSELIDEDKPT